MLNQSIFTIGHGGREFQDLLAQLKGQEIQFLIDVRSKPYSKHQPIFARESLNTVLATAGIKYVFMGDLLGGIPDDADCYTNGKVDYSKYRTKISFGQGIDRLKNAVNQGYRVCLLCSEAKPWQCHRSKLVGAALADEGIDVLHLLPNGAACTQEDVLLRVTEGQQSLFGEAMTSRRVYR